ncbi:MAG: hypothetical protein R3251_03100 [Candidatus Spechtbacterales bacterium]|nr:hypothetical protein [Candidatus Spechtbacterales bacterium]
MIRQIWEELILLPFLVRDKRKRARLILKRAIERRGWGVISPFGRRDTQEAWMDFLDVSYGIDGYDDVNIDRFLELPPEKQRNLERGGMVMLSPEGGLPGPRKQERLYGRVIEYDTQEARESQRILIEKLRQKLTEASEQSTQNPQQ